MIRVSGLLIEDMRTAVCIRFCVAAKERGAGGSGEQARERAAGVKRRRDATEVHRQPMPERSGGREPKAQAMSKTRSGLRRHGRFVSLVFARGK